MVYMFNTITTPSQKDHTLIILPKLGLCHQSVLVKTMLEAKGGSHHVAKVVACMVGPLSCLVESPIDFFFSWSSVS
jgi:hypothetical protein